MTELKDTSGHQQAEPSRGLFDRWAMFWLFLVMTSLPMLYPYFAELWTQEHYRYFPFCLIAVGYLIYQRWDREFHPPRSWFAWGVIAVGLLSNVLAALMVYPLFAAFGFAMIVTCCLSAMKGPADRSLLGIAVTLWMVVQLPLRADRTLVAELQSITTRLSSVVLDFAGVTHAVSGNVIKLADRELFVAEACSGIQSVFTLMFIACLIVSVFRIRLWLLPIYLATAALLAIAANTLRVTMIAEAYALLDIDLATGWPHELVGYLCLAIAIAMLLSFHRLAVILFHDFDLERESNEPNPFIGLWRFVIKTSDTGQAAINYGDEVTPKIPLRIAGLISVQATFAALAVCITCFSTFIVVGSERQTISVGEDGILFDPPGNLLSGNYEMLRVVRHFSERDGDDARLGKNADVWVCDIEGQTAEAQVALSQSYHGWKELCECYEVRSWELVDRVVRKSLAVSGTQSGKNSFVRGRFRSPEGHQGYLLFSAIRPDGSIMPAITEFGVLGNRFAKRFERSGVWFREDVMMLQIWLVTNQKLSSDHVSRLESDFLRIRDQLVQRIRTTTPDTID
ncbi:exosortase U [Planctomycetes bacterium K23_9]|uniref:Transmembrane exosortase (Exosortase_EpsH) n=1 Tax=Stieleria marina TaxID=1930275 RepID=A0A517NYQ4_9BACT|nr:Transmembrane exosortase (Exosortase_EpsH) [Planctomycetes bacterium K23_9]